MCVPRRTPVRGGREPLGGRDRRRLRSRKDWRGLKQVCASVCKLEASLRATVDPFSHSTHFRRADVSPDLVRTLRPSSLGTTGQGRHGCVIMRRGAG